jgi:signal transduction histidine kinase
MKLASDTLDLILEQCRLGIILHDPEGRIIDFNQAALKITGLSAQDLFEMDIATIGWPCLHEDGSPMQPGQHPVWKAIQNGNSIRHHVFGAQPLPEVPIRWILINVYPILKPMDESITGYAVCLEDVSESHQQKLQSQEATTRFLALFQNSPVGMAYHRMIYDPAGKAIDYAFIDANPCYQQLTGIDPKGKRVTEAFPGIENDPFDWIGRFGKIARHGGIERCERYLEHNHRWYDLVAFQSGPDEFVVVFLEITDRKKQEQRLQRLVDQLRKRNIQLMDAKRSAESADRLKSAFLANMSHEIRTPMNAVMGFTELLKDENLGQEERNEYLDIIEASGNRMLNLLNDILSLSRIESGSVELNAETFSLKSSLEQILFTFVPEARQRGIALQQDLAIDETFLIRTDRRKLEQILTNLIKNALKFTPFGFVRLHCHPIGDQIHLEVADSGIGIEAQDLKRLFKPFSQIDLTGDKIREGTGLGLSIAQAQAKLLGCKIEVSSIPGKGSSFRFNLPIQMKDPRKYR